MAAEYPARLQPRQLVYPDEIGDAFNGRGGHQARGWHEAERILPGKGGVAGGAAPPSLPALPCLVLRQDLEISGSAGVVGFAGGGLAAAPPA